MRKAVASLFVLGAVSFGVRSASARIIIPPLPIWNSTELSNTLFLPIDSTRTSYTTGSQNGDFPSFGRYVNGGDLATLVVSLDSSRIPDGATIQRVCFYDWDNNATVDMEAAMWEVYQPFAGGQTEGPVNVAFYPASTGTPGYNVSCIDTKIPVNYSQTISGTKYLVDYILAVGFGDSVHTIATDGSITLQRVVVYWTK